MIFIILVDRQYLMVYIRLKPDVFILLKNYIDQDELLILSPDYYLPYQRFKYINLKYNLQTHLSLQAQDILSNAQFQKINREKLNNKSKFAQELQNKHEQRILQSMGKKMNSATYYFDKSSNSTVKEMTESLSFSLAFLFSFFMAGLTGYYFAYFFLGLSFVNSMMIALAFIIFTVVIETTLFIIRQSKTKSKVVRQKYRSEYDNFSQSNSKKQKKE